MIIISCAVSLVLCLRPLLSHRKAITHPWRLSLIRNLHLLIMTLTLRFRILIIPDPNHRSIHRARSPLRHCKPSTFLIYPYRPKFSSFSMIQRQFWCNCFHSKQEYRRSAVFATLSEPSSVRSISSKLYRYRRYSKKSTFCNF